MFLLRWRIRRIISSRSATLGDTDDIARSLTFRHSRRKMADLADLFCKSQDGPEHLRCVALVVDAVLSAES